MSSLIPTETHWAMEVVHGNQLQPGRDYKLSELQGLTMKVVKLFDKQLYDIAFTDYQHVYFMDLYMKTATVRNIAYYEKGTIDDRIIGGR